MRPSRANCYCRTLILAEVRQKDEAARNMGINSVPTFIVAGQHAVPGAQPPELWQRVIDDILEQLAQAE